METYEEGNSPSTKGVTYIFVTKIIANIIKHGHNGLHSIVHTYLLILLHNKSHFKLT
jgi:hypothetical protein